jgi:hypothetical protein
MATLFIHSLLAAVFVIVATVSGRRVSGEVRARNNAAVIVFVALLVISIPGIIRDSAASTVLLVGMIVSGITSTALLAMALLKTTASTPTKP